jgi:peptide-methionine (R)-S-oxide reductase
MVTICNIDGAAAVPVNMTRRSFLQTCTQTGALGVVPWVVPGRARSKAQSGDAPSAAGFERLEKPLSEWRKILPPPAFSVLFEDATEPPLSSPLNKENRKGIYVCAACFLPLFSSSTKYESGTGWPSFWAPIEGQLATRVDLKLLLPRTEYHCARSGGHQGHVFKDGPPPSGERWWNNGVALRFVPAGTPAPELRR